MTRQQDRSPFLAELVREDPDVVVVWAVVLALAGFGLAFFVWALLGPLP